VVFHQHLSRQSRAKVSVILFDERDCEIPNARIDLVVRSAPTGTMTDRSSTFDLERLQ